MPPFPSARLWRTRILLGALGAVLAAGGVYLAITRGGTIGELVDLAAQGGEKQLREVLRPARGGTRVVLIALDGVGHDLLERTVGDGGMPRLAALMGDATADAGVYAHAYAVPGAVAILPSTTMAAWGSVFTGEPPARTGVPGNEWFDRRTMRYFAPAPVSVQGHEHTVAMLSDGLVGNALAVPTLFERADVRSYVSLAPVYRGADLFTIPDPDLVADLFAAVAGGVVGDEPIEREAYASIDAASVDNLLETIDAHGLADLQVVYFPAVDLFTHGATEPLRQQERYLAEIIDPALGRILDAYGRAGALDDTYFVVVADHGHTQVQSDDRHALQAEGPSEPSAVLVNEGFRLRPFVLEPAEDEQDYQATVAYQGAIAYVYLADRSSCAAAGQRCDWNRAPRRDEDVLPVVRAFAAADATGAGVPALRGTLDLIMVRAVDGAGGAAIEVWDRDRLVPLPAYLARHPRPDLIRFEERMDGLVNGPFGDRAGDVLLLARSGEHRPLAERFYFSNLYRSWHGSPHAQDSRIPLWIARTGISGEALRAIARETITGEPSQLDVTPLVLTLLSR